MDTTLDALQRWFADHCDGEWENDYGIKIESCDNPGWWVRVDLAGTELSGRSFPRVAVNVDEAGFQQGDRWMCCRIDDDNVWHGAGDATKLELILKTFLAWAGESA